MRMESGAYKEKQTSIPDFPYMLSFFYHDCPQISLWLFFPNSFGTFGP